MDLLARPQRLSLSNRIAFVILLITSEALDPLGIYATQGKLDPVTPCVNPSTREVSCWIDVGPGIFGIDWARLTLVPPLDPTFHLELDLLFLWL